MTLDRRHFLQRAAAASLGFSGLGALSARGLENDWVNQLGVTGYGPLLPDPDGVIDLPSGFSYHIISDRWKSLPSRGTSRAQSFAAPYARGSVRLDFTFCRRGF